jgi:hypothetical protein
MSFIPHFLIYDNGKIKSHSTILSESESTGALN